jgi:hypothetical protein
MNHTTLNEAALANAVKNIAPNTPVYMVNLLRYRPQATYKTSDAALAATLPAVSGREAYLTRYVPSIMPILQADGSEPILVGSALAVFVGAEGEKWDDVGIVRYPSLEVFQKMATSERYARECLPHREAAIEDWRLLAVEKMDK